MKNKITALVLVAVTVLALAPKPAQAGDKELAVVGGLIGGLIIGSAISDSNRHYDRGHTTVIVDDHRHGPRHRDRGYWKEVRVKVWVPGGWVIECDRYGRDYRRYVDGHYAFRTDRVWVSYDRHGRYHGGRYHDGRSRW